MNRLLLQECLDELHSDDSVELTEGNKERWSKKRKEKWRLKRQRQTAISGVQNRPRCMSQSGTPTESGSNAGQQTRVKAPHYTPEQEAKATAFLQSLAQIIGEEMDNVDHTAYLHPTINGFLSHFRLADHRGDASQFARRNERERCFGIVVKMNEKRFVPNDETDYEEEVFFPDKLTDEKMKAISDGVANYIQTGVYNGPKGDESNPQEPLHPNPVNQSVPWQQPQTPATPPTEPGVQEAFFSRFSNLDYLYQILDEGKDRLIDRLPSLDDAQKAQMKQFFAKRPNLESKFDWNRPDSITWDAFQNIASGYEEPIDPDTVPELSDKRDEGNGIVSYEVQDYKQGQSAMRRIIDTHWGKDANPWCLLAYQDGTLSRAWDYWMGYSALPKRVAFKDGKLLAFMATDGDYATIAKNNPNLPLFTFREMVFNGYGKPINGQISDITTDDDARYLSDETIDFLMKQISDELKNGNSLPEALHRIMYDGGYDIFDWVYKNKKKFSVVELNPHREIWWDRIDKPHFSVHDCV